MQHASGAEFLVWLIVAILIAISKGLGKLQERAGKTPPVKPPPVQRPPEAIRRPVSERAVPPLVRPLTPEYLREIVRDHQPSPAAPRPRTAPPRAVAAKQTQRAGRPRSLTEPLQPKPVTPSTAATPVPPARPATAAAQAVPARLSPWAEALREKTNLRNIIISAEIIGPPKALNF
jgi:hypothetical protein